MNIINFVSARYEDLEEIAVVEQKLKNDKRIGFIATTHHETTVGILNPIKKIGDLCKKYRKIFIVDTISSFAGIYIDGVEQSLSQVRGSEAVRTNDVSEITFCRSDGYYMPMHISMVKIYNRLLSQQEITDKYNAGFGNADNLQVGETLSVDVSNVVDPNGLAGVEYQWYADNSPILDATGSSYIVTQEEINKYNRFVTFTHLPDKATIRIFNLSGVHVRTIEKDDLTQFQRWDLANDSGLPVASGLYIAYIEMPELGETKILKLAIIQEQQILDRF